MNEKSKSIPMKPLYVFESKSNLLAVMPVMIKKGFVSIRIQHETETGTKKLSCKASSRWYGHIARCRYSYAGKMRGGRI